jgi:predicted P-loop ATPase
MGLSPENQNTLAHAQYLAQAGFIPLLVPSIRLVMRESGPQPECQCWLKEKCSAPGKHPARSWKDIESPLQAMNLVLSIISAAKPYETYNLGLKTGRAGGIFVIDIDLKPDGTSGFQNWDAFLSDKKINDSMHYETLTARTGGGGMHLVYPYPKNGDRIPCAVNHAAFNYKLNPKNPALSGVDVRGDGGFIVVYPSRHKSGRFYEWLNDPATSLRPEAPAAILMAVSAEKRSRDPDADYTPEKEELEALAERMIRKKRSQTTIDIGRDLKNVLAGIPIHVDGAAHDPFRSITFRVAQEWPRANAARMMEFFADSIRAREEKVPGGSCTHDDVLNGLVTALEKCREASEHWESKLIPSKIGEGILTNVTNATNYLRNDPLWHELFATNARSDRPHVMRPPPGLALGDSENNRYPRGILDVDEVYVTTCFERRFQTTIQHDNIRKAILTIAAERAFDPFLQYLERLPPWDGIGRVDTWLSVLGGAEDIPINRAFGAIWLLQAVYRTLEPGCQADYCLLLEGNQGIGKSSMLRALVPDPSLFDDGLKPIDHTASKDNLIKLGGPVILELAELGALRKGDVEFIKAFLTFREDTYRPLYKSHPITMRRRCVFAGTTNSSQYLRDSTGNRRFFPVKLSDAKINIELVKANRDQIWAEALMRARRNEPAFLSPEFEAVAIEVQSERRVEDAWQELLENWLDAAEARIREVTCHDLSVKEPTERLGPIIADEIAEDPDKIASMFWLEKYDDARVPELDAEDVRIYGEKEHFSLNCFMDHTGIDTAQRPRVVQEVANTLRSMGYESVRWSKRDNYRGKNRWLRKNRQK